MIIIIREKSKMVCSNATLIGQGVLISSQQNQVATIVQVSITSNSTFLPFNSSNILIEGTGFSSESTIFLFSQSKSYFFKTSNKI